MWTALALALITAAAPPPPESPAVGTRVRLTAPGATVEGTLVGADPTWLHVRRSEKAPIERVHRASVTRVEVLRGRRSAARKGALVGFGVAAATGVGLYVSVSGPSGSDTPRSAGGFLVSAAVPGVAGAAIGALLGLAASRDDWREVPLGALPGAEPRGSAPARLGQAPEAKAGEAPAEGVRLRFAGGAPGPLRRAMKERTAIHGALWPRPRGAPRGRHTAHSERESCLPMTPAPDQDVVAETPGRKTPVGGSLDAVLEEPNHTAPL
jgi:hypothetical protein